MPGTGVRVAALSVPRSITSDCECVCLDEVVEHHKKRPQLVLVGLLAGGTLGNALRFSRSRSVVQPRRMPRYKVKLSFRWRYSRLLNHDDCEEAIVLPYLVVFL